MNIAELHEELDNYGDHLEVAIVVNDGEHEHVYLEFEVVDRLTTDGHQVTLQAGAVITTLFGLVRSFFDEFEYKPDTTFEIESEVYGIQVWAIRHIPDSRRPEHPIVRVHGRLSLDDFMMRTPDPKRELQERVHSWLIDLEVHEVNEWFKVAGTLPYDPHKEA